jgi:nucleoside-diphosphate-sugar epimerase
MKTNGSYVVTGGGGLVGGHLVQRLVQEGAREVVVVDDYSSSAPWVFPPSGPVRLCEGSILDLDVLSDLPERPDAVFHVAGFVGNENSMRDPERDLRVNALGTLRVLEYARRSRAGVVVLTSAGCSLAPKGDGPPVAVTEELPLTLDLDTPYQISKLAAELYGRYYARMRGLPVVTARLQNVYGPGEVPGTGPFLDNPWKNVIPKFIFLAMTGQPLVLTGTGNETRDFIYGEDVARGMCACADAKWSGQAFNLATGQETPLRRVAERVNELTGKVAGIVHQPRRDWDRSGRKVASIQKARAVLGWEPKIPFDEGLTRTVDWFRAHWGRIEQTMGVRVQ